MANLSDESIRDFQRIFKEQYGKEMSWEEAADAGGRLVDFFELLYKIDRRTHITETSERGSEASLLVHSNGRQGGSDKTN